MWKQIRHWLVPPVFDNQDKTRSAALLNSILLILIVGASIFIPLVTFLGTGDDGIEIFTLVAGLPIIFIAVGLFIANRRGHVTVASHIITATLYLIALINIYQGGDAGGAATVGLILVIAIAGVLLGGRWAIIYAILSSLGISLISYLQLNNLLPPPLPPSLLIDTALYVVIGLIVGLLLRSTMNALNDALRQVEGANLQLRVLSSSLEERVTARTLDITLAAEIGRRLAQQRDINQLLNETVHLIQSTFHLYHVQVYLLGNDEKQLLLRSATNIAGSELLQRHHHLPIGSGSINGLAALERRSIVISNVLEDPTFRPNPLLPETRCEMAVPLLIRDQLVGTLNLQGNTLNQLTMDNLPAFETLAGQLAIALDNATLFVQIRRSQELLTEQTRRLARENWQDYMNAINHEEQLDYTYSSLQGVELEETGFLQTASAPLFITEIKVLDEAIGIIEIENAPQQRLGSEDIQIVQAVAVQVAQQIENLRLLDEAERFRVEAEEANRRLTRAGWETYAEAAEMPAFVYHDHRVRAVARGDVDVETADLARSLQIRGENIGLISLSHLPDNSEQLNSAVAAIADTLSAHIENLRLTQTTQTVLAQTEEQAYRLEQLNKLSAQLTGANSQQEILDFALSQIPPMMAADSAGLILLAENGRSFTIFTLQEGTATLLPTPDGPQMSLDNTSAETVFQEGQVMLIRDIRQSNKRDLQDMVKSNVRSIVHAPLAIGDRVLGILTIMNREGKRAFTESDANLLQQVASVVVTTLENQRLFEQANRRANRESIINTINQRIQRATTIEAALEVAVREIGQHLKVRQAVVALDSAKATGQEMRN